MVGVVPATRSVRLCVPATRVGTMGNSNPCACGASNWIKWGDVYHYVTTTKYQAEPSQQVGEGALASVTKAAVRPGQIRVCFWDNWKSILEGPGSPGQLLGRPQGLKVCFSTQDATGDDKIPGGSSWAGCTSKPGYSRDPVCDGMHKGGVGGNCTSSWSVAVVLIGLHVQVPAAVEKRNPGASCWTDCLEGTTLNICMFPTNSPSSWSDRDRLLVLVLVLLVVLAFFL